MKKLLTLAICILMFTIPLQNKVLAFDGEEDRLSISGFMDFQVNKIFEVDDTNSVRAFPFSNENLQFMQNNLNLYFNFKVDDDWKAFTEIRFLYLPTGSLELEPHFQDVDGDGAPDIYVDSDNDGNLDSIATPDGSTMTMYNLNNTTDQTQSLVEYGSIYIERAYIEYNKFPFASIRFGRFFTPFGIWSNDHGSPAVTSARFPYIVLPISSIGSGMPTKQTGFELVGKIPLSSTIIDYAIYTGNGVSNTSSIGDQFDDDKSVGCFLNFKTPLGNILEVEFGGSGYRGKKTILYERFITQPTLITWNNPIPLVYSALDFNEQNDVFASKQWETAGMAHLKISIFDLPLDSVFIVQAEGMRQWIKPDNDDRIKDPVLTTIGSATGITYNKILQSDYQVDIMYVQAELQISGFITPYFRYEKYANGTKVPMQLIGFNEMEGFIGGLNFKPTPRVSIKAEYAVFALISPMIYLDDPTRLLKKVDNTLPAFTAQIAVAF